MWKIVKTGKFFRQIFIDIIYAPMFFVRRILYSWLCVVERKLSAMPISKIFDLIIMLGYINISLKITITWHDT